MLQAEAGFSPPRIVHFQLGLVQIKRMKKAFISAALYFSSVVLVI